MITRASWTIARKELKSYIDRPAAYILLVVFVAISLFLFFRTAFLSGEASMRPLFNVIPWILLFFVPPITMRLFSEEEKQGTMELLLTQPISDLDILVGKFAGALIFVALALASTLPVALTLRLGGPVDYGIVFSQYLGALLLSAVFVATGLFASGLTSNQVVASIIAMTINFGLLILGFDAVLLAAPYVIGQVFQSVSALTHFENMGRGVIDLRDVVYFVGMVAGFGALAYFTLKAKRISKSSPYYRNLQSGVAALVAICVIANVLAGYAWLRADLTENNLFTLSPATERILGDLEDVVTVKLYASPELPGELALTFRDTRDLLSDYARTSRGKVQVKTLYPVGEDKVAQEAAAAGVRQVQFNVVGQDEFQLKNGYLGIAVQFGSKKEAVPFVQSTEDLEYQLTGLIHKLTAKDRKTVAFLAGHGEKGQYKELATFGQELSKQYETKEVSASGKKGLDLKGVSTLVVAGPNQKIDKAERQAITKFLDSGGNALFLIDALTVNPQFLMGMPNPNSLADYLKQFGVGVKEDMVYDLQSHETVQLNSDAGPVMAPYPLWPRVALVSPEVGGEIRSIVLPWASSVEASKGAGAVPLLRTTEAAGAQTKDFNIAPDQAFAEKGLAPRSMALALPKVGSSGKGRLIVVGNSSFVTDDFARQAPENVAFALNSVDWLTQQKSLGEIRSKRSQPRRLAFSSDLLRQTVHYGNLIGIPILIALYGMLHLLKRRRIAREGSRG
ncbi:MAG: hypothetical protein C4521_03350 [Actinobacteria bacterium]|nr:MAG: hypothetical protein C4521_03350 [Actinomycetota bacterium]